jgi:hypothetical protein
MGALGINQKLLSAQSALNDKGTVPDVFGTLGLTRTTHIVKWGTGVSAGAVIIEVADDSTYTGTWAPVATITYASGSPKADYAYVEGHYGSIRHRIATAVVGGTVDTFIQGADQ